MLKCVECEYEGGEFSICIAGSSQGAFTYIAKCPRCGSRKVKHLPGYHESDLRISVEEEKTSVLKERGDEKTENPDKHA